MLSAEQTGEFLDDAAVAFTRLVKQARPVQYGYFAAFALDEALRLERVKHVGNAGAPDAQHDRQEFVCQGEGVRTNSVLRRGRSQRQQRFSTVWRPLQATP